MYTEHEVVQERVSPAAAPGATVPVAPVGEPAVAAPVADRGDGHGRAGRSGRRHSFLDNFMFGVHGLSPQRREIRDGR